MSYATPSTLIMNFRALTKVSHYNYDSRSLEALSTATII